MNRIFIALAALVWLVLTVPLVGADQPQEDGWAILKEANTALEKSASREELRAVLEKLQAAVEIFKRSGSPKGEGAALRGIGRVYGTWGQYREALEYFEKALELQRKAEDIQGQGVTLSEIGVVYWKLGQFPKAFEYYERGLDAHRRAGDTAEEGVTLNNIGLIYLTRGQYRKTLELYDKALEIHRSVKNVKEEGMTLNNIGLTYKNLAQYDKALDYYQQSLERYRTAAFADVGPTLNNIGEIHTNWGQYQKALPVYEDALQAVTKLGDRQGEAITVNNIAVLYQNWGQYHKALELYERALDIYRKVGDEHGEGVTLHNMASVYAGTGQYRKALELYEESLAIDRRAQYVRGEGYTLNRIGEVYAMMGRFKDALANFQKTLEIYTKTGAPAERTKDFIGNAYLDAGQLDKAEPFLRDAGFDASLGRFYLVKADFRRAKTHYERLLADAEKSSDADDLFTANTGLGRVYEGLQNYEAAEEHYARAVALTEEIRSSLLPAERKNFFDVKINGFPRSEPAKGLTRVRMKLNQPARSIESSEITRARAFADSFSINATGDFGGVPRSVLEQEEELVTRLASLKKERNRTSQGEDPERYGNLVSEIRKTENELQAFVAMLWQKYRPYASVRYPRPVTLTESALGPDEHLIVFDVTTEGIATWLLKGKQIVDSRFIEIDVKTLEAEIRSFRAAFEQAKLDAFDPALGHRLYVQLIATMLAHVPKGVPLMLIPDGPLAVLPFEALVASGTAVWRDGPYGRKPEGLTYFGDLHPISYHQSITALTLARTLAGDKKSPERLLVVADPVFQAQDQRAGKAQWTTVAASEKKFYVNLMSAIEDSSEGTFRLERLPETATLAEHLSKLYGGNSDILTGFEANKTQVLRAMSSKLEQYGGIVLATHGLFTNRIPGITEPFLALSMIPEGTDGFLRMSEVMGLRLNAEIVALTACQTALGQEVSGEGVMSMGRAFQYAGAKSVLMTLWSVAETSSVQMADSFFGHMKEGKNRLECLRLARAEIRSRGFDHPFFWAPFILVGEVQ